MSTSIQPSHHSMLASVWFSQHATSSYVHPSHYLYGSISIHMLGPYCTTICPIRTDMCHICIVTCQSLVMPRVILVIIFSCLAKTLEHRNFLIWCSFESVQASLERSRWALRHEYIFIRIQEHQFYSVLEILLHHTQWQLYVMRKEWCLSIW
jgi:hypothetical protein